jgi:anti-sigma factor RsiW
MDHEQAFELLPGYVDEELSLSEAREVERHLAGCPQCQEVYDQQRQASTQLRQAELRVEAPPELMRRVRAALPLRRSLWQRVFGEPAGSSGGAGRGGASLGWAPLGAMAVSFAALAWSAGLYLAIPPSDAHLTQELVDSHVRSLQFDHLYDVISTDRHTVKPWFDGKLDFAPPVIDLAQQGYPLVYRYKLHPINLYVWPGNDAGATPHLEERMGYHLAHWSAAGMNYWAITDAGASELNGFINGLRARSAS